MLLIICQFVASASESLHVSTNVKAIREKRAIDYSLSLHASVCARNSANLSVECLKRHFSIILSLSHVPSCCQKLSLISVAAALQVLK